MSDHDDPTHVGQALLRLIEAGAAPHVRVRERDVEVIISVPSSGMDGGRRRRASTTAPTVGRALARARVMLGVPVSESPFTPTGQGAVERAAWEAYRLAAGNRELLARFGCGGPDDARRAMGSEQVIHEGDGTEDDPPISLGEHVRHTIVGQGHTARAMETPSTPMKEEADG